MSEPAIAFEIAPAERSNDALAGVDYGSIRVLVRAPGWIVFTGAGSLHCLKSRDARPSHRDHDTLGSGRLATALLEQHRDTCDARLGVVGAGAAALAAWKARGTALVDGGGAPLPKPRHEQRQEQAADYATWTINHHVDLTGRVADCLQCAKTLRPTFNVHHFHLGPNGEPTSEHPRSLADCQRLTNHTVVAIHDFGRERPALKGYVCWFDTWDGEAVADPFCSDGCAAEYGRRAARDLPKLADSAPAPKPLTTFTAVAHGPPLPERRI